MPVASDDVVWLDVLPSMGRFRSTLQTEAGGAADTAGKDAGGRFTGAFGKALKVGAVLGGALAVGAAGAFLKQSIDEASNLNESLNAVNVTFGKNAEGIMRLGKTSAESLGLSNSQFNSLAVQFSAFATTIAGKGGDVTGVMKDLTTRGADFASVMNLDVNEAMGLFQSGLAGETEPLRKYGIDLSAAAVENYALSHGIAESAGTMTEAQKVQARYAFLMEQTSKVQGDFGNTSSELANSQRILSARWDDIQAKVGSKVLPILKDLSGWAINTGLPAFMAFGGWLRDTLSPVFGEITGGITAFSNAWKYNDGEVTSSGFPGFMERLGYIAHQVFDYFRNTLIPTLRDIGEAVLPVVGAAFRTVGDIVSGTVRFFRDHEGAAKALGITVGIVGGLIAAAWVAQATVSTINSVKSVLAWFATATASTTSATIQSRSTAQIVVGWLAASASAAWNALKIVAAWTVGVAQTGILMAMYAAQSVAAAARSAAAWVASQVRTVASLAVTAAGFVAQGAVMLASMAVTAAGVVASWVLMGVQSMIRAAQMAAAWVLAMGPIGWIIAAVVGLVALIIANWDTVKAWTIAIWNAVVGFIKDAASAIWTWVTEKFEALKNGVVAIFTAVRDTVVSIWTAFKDAVIAVVMLVVQGVIWYYTTLWNGVVAIFTFLRDGVMAIWNAFRDAVIAVATWIWNTVVTAFTNLKNNAVAIFTAVRDTVVGVWNGFRDTVVGVAKNIWDWVVEKFNGLKTGAVGIFTSIRDTIKGIWEGLVDAVKAPIRIVFTFVNDKMIGPVNSLLDKFPGNLSIPKLPMFRKGGYTGDGPADKAAGIVHAGEYVFTQEQVRRLGLPRIEAIANGAIPRRGELAPARETGGVGDWLGGAWDATGGKVVTGLGNAVDWVGEMAAKGARFVAEKVLNPLRDMAKGLTPNNVIGNFLDGAIDKFVNSVLGKSDEYDKAAAADGGGSGVPAGDGSLGSNFSSLFATIKAIIPQARLNSGIRNTADAHGRGKAVDFGFGTGPGGAGSAGLALIKRTLHDRFGKNLYELIYNGIGNDRPNLKNSKPLAYSAAIQQQHKNHVHAAVYDQGGLWEPGTAGFNFTGGVERVLTPPQDAYFRKFVDLGDRLDKSAASMPPVHLYTPDIPHALRALREEEQQREALAPAW